MTCFEQQIVNGEMAGRVRVRHAHDTPLPGVNQDKSGRPRVEATPAYDSGENGLDADAGGGSAPAVAGGVAETPGADPFLVPILQGLKDSVAGINETTDPATVAMLGDQLRRETACLLEAWSWFQARTQTK